MGTVDLSDRLREIRCPTLAVVPGRDPIGSRAQYEVLRERIPDVEFVIYEGAPHNIADALADRCAEELRRFLLARRAAPADPAAGATGPRAGGGVRHTQA